VREVKDSVVNAPQPSGLQSRVGVFTERELQHEVQGEAAVNDLLTLGRPKAHEGSLALRPPKPVRPSLALRGVLKELKGDASVVEAVDSRQALRLAGENPDLGLVLST
jgi:hypothetical protein